MDAWECIPHLATILLRNEAFTLVFCNDWDPCSGHTVLWEALSLS